jgi:hypothetical protein
MQANFVGGIYFKPHLHHIKKSTHPDPFFFSKSPRAQSCFPTIITHRQRLVKIPILMGAARSILLLRAIKENAVMELPARNATRCDRGGGGGTHISEISK